MLKKKWSKPNVRELDVLMTEGHHHPHDHPFFPPHPHRPPRPNPS